MSEATGDGSPAENERLQIDFLARVVDVASDEVARSVVFRYDAFGDFAALDARLTPVADRHG